MKFQLVAYSSKGGIHSLRLGSVSLCLGILALITGGAYLGQQYRDYQALSDNPDEGYYVAKWNKILNEHTEELTKLQSSMSGKVSSLVSRLGVMQAELNHLDALGLAMAKKFAHDTELAELATEWPTAKGLGGPEGQNSLGNLGNEVRLGDLDQEILTLSDGIRLRKQQLMALSNYFSTSVLQEQVYPAGFPVLKGWISSPYGYRISPFTGKRSFHYGIDIASRYEEPIRAIASGIVVYSGSQHGYGNLIEIDHGNSYTTRYAHHKTSFVSEGTTVRKNDIVALIGNEGNSTGPHLHLEVLNNNRHINPLEFIERNN